MNRYIIIESKHPIQQEKSLILSLFDEFLHADHVETKDRSIIIMHQDTTEVSLEDVILNIMSDTLSDLRAYESRWFDHPEDAQRHLDWCEEVLASIPFNRFVYLNDRTLLSFLLPDLDSKARSMFLGKYEKDHMMLDTIRTYLESNQNMMMASKRLYVHRNTLIQRLEKFFQATGFDVRLFQDAFLIYQMIR